MLMVGKYSQQKKDNRFDMDNDKKQYFGKVIWFNDKAGYGFIQWEIDDVAQKDMFCYWSDIASDGFKSLKKDQVVSFFLGQNNKGEPKATEIKVIKKA